MKNEGIMERIVLLTIAFFIASVIVTLVGLYFHYNNKEISLRNRAEAQRKNIESVYDNVWKVISGKGEVAEKYAEDFKKIYPAVIGGRYSDGGGSVMKWINEHNPEFDTSLYSSLSDSIECLRMQFVENQKLMLDIIREHTTLCESYPARWFVSNSGRIEYEVVSSEKSKKAVSECVDDEARIFKKQ